MPGNKNLLKAKNEKNDEFYTQLVDIENELSHYKDHFKGKTIFCNCDDPYESNFFQYFANNFKHLGLKKLITMGYCTSPIAQTQLSLFKQPYKIEINDIIDVNKDGAINKIDVDILIQQRKNKGKIIVTELKGDGDFRSEESLDCLEESDIVVTNPPFSLAREFVNLLINKKKKFLIIGDDNWVAYKDIFPLIKNNIIWKGYTHVKEFIQPDESKKKFGNKCWYTNLDIKKRHEKIILYKKYNPQEYPKYFNYEAIDVNRVTDIPIDYYGEMGIPITFLDKYNPEQFEIIGIGSDVPKTLDHIAHKDLGIINYEKNGQIIWSTPYTVSERKIGNSLRLEKNGLPSSAPYNRIIIKRKS